MEDALLIADELGANLVRHGGGCLCLQIRATDGRVTIATADGAAIVPISDEWCWQRQRRRNGERSQAAGFLVMRPPLPPRPPQPAGPCPLARQFWVTAGACEVVTVGTTRIGVVVRAATDSRFHLR